MAERNNIIHYSSRCLAVHLDQKNAQPAKRGPAENLIMSSCLNAFEAEIKTKGLGLKYVAAGKELYHFQNKEFHVGVGQYLLVNENIPVVDTRINTPNTWAMCINIDLPLVTDLVHQVVHPNQLDEDPGLLRYFFTDELFVNKVEAGTMMTGTLNSMISSMAADVLPGKPEELLFDVAALLVEENLPTIRSYYNLQAAKTTTRKELFRRIRLGREILNSCCEQPVHMKTVAEQCFLSEFRFYRLFKQCFGLSPCRYLLEKRIERGIALRKENFTWTEIALRLNFTDLAAFSNAFKKIKGVSPKQYFSS